MSHSIPFDARLVLFSTLRSADADADADADWVFCIFGFLFFGFCFLVFFGFFGGLDCSLQSDVVPDSTLSFFILFRRAAS